MANMIRLLLVPILILVPVLVAAQEAYVLGGAIQERSRSSANSFMWGLSYFENLSDRFALSFSYLNEGHPNKHHRDGLSAQFWARTNPVKSISFSVGAGPYYNFDTIRGHGDEPSRIVHSVAAAFSIAATVHRFDPLLVQIRANLIEGPHSYDSISLIAGIGYRLDRTATRPTRGTSQVVTSQNEVTGFIGLTVDNSYNSDNTFAQSVEYRRRLNHFAEWTAAWLNEGDSSCLGRNGPLSQIWLARGFYDDRLSLGIGVGPYLAFDDYETKGRERHITVLVPVGTMTGVYRFDEKWGVRVSWNRVVSHYDRDSDVVMAGVSRRF